MYYVHRYLKFATFWTNTYPWCASSRAAVVAACYLIPQKNGCANILRQKTLTLVNFTTQFSYFPGCSGYLVCCMTPGFVCVMIGSKKEIGTTLIDFLSNLVRCVYTWELTLARSFQKNFKQLLQPWRLNYMILALNELMNGQIHSFSVFHWTCLASLHPSR